MVTLAVPAVVVGAAALAQREARSVGLFVLSTLVVIEIAWVVLIYVAFGGVAVALDIVLGVIVAVLLGVFFGRRVWAPPTPSHG